MHIDFSLTQCTGKYEEKTGIFREEMKRKQNPLQNL